MGYLWRAKLSKVRGSHDILVTFTSLYQTPHASSPPPLLMAQFQEQKYNQAQHWPAVCVKNMVFMTVRPISSRVMAKSNWVKYLTAFITTTDNRWKEKKTVQCLNSLQFSQFKHVWRCITLQNTFSLCRISIVQLPTCQPQSGRLLSQNWVFRLTGVWNSFTSHLFSDFILNQGPFSTDGGLTACGCQVHFQLSTLHSRKKYWQDYM